MYIKTVTDYDKMTECYNITLSSNCTMNEINIDIIIPALLFTIPCGQSFLCLISFMVYTLIKPLFNIKRIRIIIFNQIILYVISYVVLLT